VLLFIWRQYVDREQRRWQARVSEGYYALAVDLTAFWRQVGKDVGPNIITPEPEKPCLP
jgi:hypothetical protein